MPKISLWKNKKDNDYNYIDGALSQYFDMSGTGVHVHRYIGTDATSGITNIQDVVFLENRSRKYSDDIIELRGLYKPQDNEFDLSQFGIFLSNDTIIVSFHYSKMIKMLGRKLMSGDVIELPHLRDPDSLDEDNPATNRYYVVEDATHSADGYNPRWWSHIWRIKAKQLRDAPEYSDILGEGDGTIVDGNDDIIGILSGDDQLKTSLSTYKKDIAITDAINVEAEANVKFDPMWMDATHLWVEELSTGEFNYYMFSGDGIPPNGKPLSGSGTEFPTTLKDGDFYLRTDFTPNRLFRKLGNVYQKIEDDIRIKWTGYNKILDTFIDNRSTDVMTDGTVRKTKKALSKVVKPKIDSHSKRRDDINGGNT